MIIEDPDKLGDESYAQGWLDCIKQINKIADREAARLGKPDGTNTEAARRGAQKRVRYFFDHVMWYLTECFQVGEKVKIKEDYPYNATVCGKIGTVKQVNPDELDFLYCIEVEGFEDPSLTHKYWIPMNHKHLEKVK